MPVSQQNDSFFCFSPLFAETHHWIVFVNNMDELRRASHILATERNNYSFFNFRFADTRHGICQQHGRADEGESHDRD